MQVSKAHWMIGNSHLPWRWMVVILIFELSVGIVATGCSKKARELAPLHGKVTCRGKPLSFGTVGLQSGCGQGAVGIIQPDGTFQMETRGEGPGTVVGKNAVRVTCFERQNPAMAAKPAPAGVEASLGKLLIPRKYTSYSTSGITVDVRSGSNEPLVLNLQD